MRCRESMAMAVPITITLNWPSKIIFYSIGTYENINRRKIQFCIDWYNYISPMKKIHFSTVDFMSSIWGVNTINHGHKTQLITPSSSPYFQFECFINLVVIKTILTYQIKRNDCVWPYLQHMLLHKMNTGTVS